MAKFTAFLFIIFLIILSLLAFFNKHSVDLTVWEGVTYNIPVVALILISAAVGTFTVLIAVAIRDARRYLEHWKEQRVHKKVLKVQDLYSKGMEAFFASRNEEARDLFLKVVDEDPGHVNALLRLGDIHFNNGDFVRAREFYAKANEVRPRNIEVLFSLERLFEAQERWQEALRYLDNILEIDDENPKALYRKREIFERTGRWEDVIDVQNRIIKGSVSSDQKEKEERNLNGYRYELGLYYLGREETDKAIKTFKSIIKTDKDFVPAYLALADAYLKHGDSDEAEEILRKGFAETSSLVILTRLEDHLMGMGEPDKAIDLYQKALQQRPQDARLQFLLAKLYYRLEMIDHAFETATSIDTASFDSTSLHVLLGSIYERRTQHDKAVEEFRKAFNIERPLMVPFSCRECGHISKDWVGRCPGCRQWNTLTLDGLG
jgi:tetratricopeptide (TPR) repeat protein